MLAKEKKLRLPRARTITKIRVKARLQTLPFLSPSKLLTQKLPRQKLRTLVLVLHLFKDMYFALIINEDMLLLFYKS